MGFWSSLGTLGGMALAPFTGGASLPIAMGLGASIGGAAGSIADSLSNAGQVGGNAAASAAQGRLAEGQLTQGQDRNALGLYNAQLAAAQQAINQHSQLAHQAGQGDVMSNVQDVNISGLPSNVHMGNVTGGLRPSLLGPNARQAGQTLSRNALLQLLQGDTNLPKAPQLTPLPQANGLDKVNAGLGYAGSMAGALSPLFQPKGGPQPYSVWGDGVPVDPENQAQAWPLDGSLFGGNS